MISMSFAVRNAVGLAGFTTVGTPARNAGASFSNGPHTGKLNALTCTATPWRGVQMCWPRNVPPRPSGSRAPSTYTVSLGSSRLALDAYASSHADAAVDVELRVEQRGAGASGDRVELVTVLAQVSGERLQQCCPLVEGQLTQGRTADRAPEVERGTEVDTG